MLEIGIEFRDVDVDLGYRPYAYYRRKAGKGYKNMAKVIWKLIRAYPEAPKFLNTNVFTKDEESGRWVYFMTFDDRLYHEPGCLGCRADFGTRKRVQKYLRHIRKCVGKALKEELLERRKFTGKFHITYLD